jgi:preprotein translocase subunit SecE
MRPATPGAKELKSMSTKTALVNGEESPSPIKRQSSNAVAKLSDSVVDTWKEFRRFLSDVRSEMRKVVTPSRKEVQATTSVVILAVFLFGVYFFVVDAIFKFSLHTLLGKLGGF